MSIRYTIRQYWRFSTRRPVYYLGDGLLGKGQALDISLKGGQVNGDQGVRVGMILTLAVFVTGEAKAITLEKAVVRWAQDGSFGVRTLVMKPEDLARLSCFVGVLLQKHGADNIDMHSVSR